MHNHTRYLIIFIMLCCNCALHAQPVAQVTESTGIIEKYIFYWGDFQAELSAESNYSAQQKISSTKLLEALHKRPYIWNGHQMTRQLRFKVADQWVEFDEQTPIPNDNMDALYRHIEPQCIAGNTISITAIPLSPTQTGRIDWVVEAPTVVEISPKEAEYRFTSYGKGIESIKWGPIRSSNAPNYLTMDQFQAMLDSEPLFNWFDQSAAENLELNVSIQAEYGQVHVIAAYLPQTDRYENDYQLPDYRTMVNSMRRSMAHLFKAGTKITFAYTTAKQHDKQAGGTIILMEPDPVQHNTLSPPILQEVEIKWGTSSQKIKMYLTQIKQQDGRLVSVDLWTPIESKNQLYLNQDSTDFWSLWGKAPEILVNGRAVKGLQFTLSHDEDYAQVAGAPLPPQLVTAIQKQERPHFFTFRVSQINSAEHYDFSQLSIRFWVNRYF
jgi:hypothetical protein